MTIVLFHTTGHVAGTKFVVYRITLKLYMLYDVEKWRFLQAYKAENLG